MAQNNLLNKLANINVATGQAINRSRKSVDLGNYQNISNAVGTNTYNPQTTVNPSAFSNLGNISTQYGGNTAYESFHPGVDIANKVGTPIPAFVGGTVEDVVTGSGWTPGKPSFGNYVVIRDKYGNKQRYSHLYNTYVKVGEEVPTGKPIGTMGYSGSTYSRSQPNNPAAASHLDYRVKAASGNYISPYDYLSKYQ